MPRKKRPQASISKRAPGKPPSKPAALPSDSLLDAAQEHWPYILLTYQRFEDKKPVMLLDLQEQRIYAYPYLDFLADLSPRSQQLLKDQYERAVRDNKIVVFVRDNEQRKLVSFSMASQ